MGAILLWYFSSLAITESVAPKWFEPLSDFTTALCGALAGAFFAFKFNDKIETAKRNVDERKIIEKEVALINRALLNIALQLNIIGNIKKVLDEQENIHHAAFAMPAFTNFHDSARVDVGELALILTESPQLLLEISIAQDGFIQTLESLKVRNAFYVETLQPEMASAGLLDRKTTLEEYTSKLRPGVFKTAYTSINTVIANTNESNTDLMKMFAQLRVEAKSKYPGYKLMNM